MLSWQAGHKAFTGRSCAAICKRQQTHTYVEFSPLTMFTSDTGPKLVTNMSVFTSVMPPATEVIKLTKNVSQHKMHLKHVLKDLRPDPPPDPGLSLLSYPSNSRSKMRVMLSELIFSFPLTLLKLQRKESNIRNMIFFFLLLLLPHSLNCEG